MLDEVWRLSPAVSLRREPFGALAYHFGNRRLTFLKRIDLLEVVESLDGSRVVRAALELASVPESQWPAYLRVLAALAEADMITCHADSVVVHA